MKEFMTGGFDSRGSQHCHSLDALSTLMTVVVASHLTFFLAYIVTDMFLYSKCVYYISTIKYEHIKLCMPATWSIANPQMNTTIQAC